MVDFSQCTNLVSVHVDGLLIGQQAKVHAAQAWLKTFFPHISSPNLIEVSISLSMDPANNAAFWFTGLPDYVLFETYNWAGLIEPLMTRYIDKALSEIRIAVRGYPSYLQQHTEDFLRKGPLSALHAGDRFRLDFPFPVQ